MIVRGEFVLVKHRGSSVLVVSTGVSKWHDGELGCGQCSPMGCQATLELLHSGTENKRIGQGVPVKNSSWKERVFIDIRTSIHYLICKWMVVTWHACEWYDVMGCRYQGYKAIMYLIEREPMKSGSWGDTGSSSHNSGFPVPNCSGSGILTLDCFHFLTL